MESSSRFSIADQLSASQQEQLAVLLERYLMGMEAGVAPTVEELAGDQVELIEPLRGYVAGLQDLHRVAIGFADPSETSGDSGFPASLAGDGEKQLGDFRLSEVIGRGGMGIVYRAEQQSLGRTVAIKLLPVASLLDAKQVDRFRNEAQAAACLQHPNIVPVYGVGCENGVHYYAMQFIDGSAMDQRIASIDQDGGSSNWREMVRLAVQAARGLHAAHEMGIVHRDIKPSNLMVDRNGKLWITDFGLARYRTDVSLTQSGDIVGTMRYMSPEQAGGDSVLVDGRADIYSLGATLYEMLALRPAIDADNCLEVLRRMDEQSVPRLRALRGDLPRDLESVVAKSMASDRNDRYESAESFADDLQRVLDGRPTIARPPTAVDLLGHWVSKNQRAVAVTLILGVVSLIGLGSATALIAAAKQESDWNFRRAEASEHRTRDAYRELGNQAAEWLEAVPGAEPVRRRLLLKTLEFYEQFIAEAINDPELQRDLAITYDQIGTIHSELGDHHLALEAFRQCEQRYAALAADSENDWELTIDWSVSQNNLAQSLMRSGDVKESARLFARAISNQESLLKAAVGPSDVDQVTVKRQLAASLNNLALLLEECGGSEEAEDRLERALEVMPVVIDEDAHKLAKLKSNLSRVIADRDPRRSAELVREALLFQSKELNKHPSDTKQATEVIVSLNNLGISQSVAGDFAGSVDSFQRAIEIGRQLHERWPDQANYRRDLVISFNQLALAQLKSGKLVEAESSFRQALAHGRFLTDTFQQDAQVQSMMGGVLNNLAFLQKQRGSTEHARESFREAVRFQTLATELAPQVARYRTNLKQHQANLEQMGDRS